MTNHTLFCATCGQRVPEKLTLASRIRLLLAPGNPMRVSDLATIMKEDRYTIAATVRTMRNDLHHRRHEKEFFYSLKQPEVTHA